MAAGRESTRQAQQSHEAQTASIDNLFTALLMRSRSADFQGVREIADQIIALAQQYEGPDSLIEARALYYHGLAAFLQRDFAATERTAARAAAIYQKHWERNRLPTSDAPVFVDTVGLLADSLFFQLRFDEAALAHEALVKYYETVPGPERWRLLPVLVKLAHELQFTGRPMEGSRQFVRAIDEWERLRREQAQVPQDVLQLFGSELLSFGFIAEAHDVLEQAVQIDETSGGPETPDKGRRLVLLGRVLRERANFFPAIDALQRGADILARSLGAQHPETISAWFHVGKAFLLGTSVFGNNAAAARSGVDTARTILLDGVHPIWTAHRGDVKCSGGCHGQRSPEGRWATGL